MVSAGKLLKFNDKFRCFQYDEGFIGDLVKKTGLIPAEILDDICIKTENAVEEFYGKKIIISGATRHFVAIYTRKYIRYVPKNIEELRYYSVERYISGLWDLNISDEDLANLEVDSLALNKCMAKCVESEDSFWYDMSGIDWEAYLEFFEI